MNKYSIYIAKKKIEKVIIEELYKKELLDFIQFNHIIKKLDEEIFKIEGNIKTEMLKNIIVKISI